MKSFFFLLISLGLFGSLSSSANQKEQPFTLVQNLSNSTFDPFIDYGEFQDNVAEEESIDFFQHGRSLAISFFGGYEAITLNMRQIYGDAPAVLGMSVSFFFDLHFAFQAHAFFPYGHYNSLWNTRSQFFHYGVDLKYYLNRQYSSKETSVLNPYLIFGPFWMSIKTRFPQTNPVQGRPIVNSAVLPTTPIIDPTAPPTTDQTLSQLEQSAAETHSSFGGKIGVGIEIPLIKQSFIGFEISYLYTVLAHENEDLSNLDLPELPQQNPNQTLFERLQFPYRPDVSGFRFFGDLVNVMVLFGVNF